MCAVSIAESNGLWSGKNPVKPEIWEKLYKNKISKEKKWKKKK
nr:MAG TPA: hypothetical protein [Bacteriophage sp.]